ncbi:MAG: hypothetical protein IPM29_17580 [Planctomycetes bacterium]|nr:hypothetical protein [Planctomycetota bacterium]
MHVELRTAAAAEAERTALVELLGPRLPLRPAAAVPEPGAVLWWHGALDAGGTELGALRAHLEAGGRALCTGDCAAVPHALGLEPDPPTPAGADTAVARGLQPLPGHPLFHRFAGGLDLVPGRAGAAGELPIASGWPVAGRVLAVERAGGRCLAARAALVEYRVGSAGRLLACDLPVRFADADDALAEPRARFFGDLFDYLASDSAGERGPAPWPRPDRPLGARMFAVAGEEAPMAGAAAPEPAPDDPLWRDVPAARSHFAPLVAPDGQTLAATADGRVEVVWCRSFQALRDLEVELAADDAPLRPLAELVATCRVHPDALTWVLPAGGAVGLRAADDGEGFCLHVRAGAAQRLRVGVRGVAELRPAAPYPGALCGPIEVATGRHGAVLVARTAELGVSAIVAADLRPQRASLCELPGRAPGAAVGVGFRREFRVAAGDELTVSFGGHGGFGAAPDGAERIEAAADGAVTVQVGEPGLDALVALVRARRATFARAARVAGGRLASLDPATADPRFATRDALTGDLLLLGWGERRSVLTDLRLCAAHQDPDGRIPVEISPSGPCRHGASDVTALFVTVLGAWHAWTEDRAGLAALWPAARAALGCLERFDRDGDGLCERGDGDEWPALPGARVDVRSAALQWRAFAAGAALAAQLGDDVHHARWQARAGRLRQVLRETFWMPGDSGYATALLADGALDERASALSAVAWALGLGEHGSETAALRRFATAPWQADWGSRLWPGDADDGGAVPAFATVFTTLADFAHGRPDAGWARWLGWARAIEAGRGAVPGVLAEALRGTAPTPEPGVPRDAFVAHAAFASVLTHGLCGWRALPDEPRIVFEPALPGGVDRVACEELTIGPRRLSAAVWRGADGADLHCELRLEGPPVELEIGPFVPAPARLGGVQLDGAPLAAVHVDEQGDGVRVRARATLAAGVHRLDVEARPDLLVATPPAGCRLLARRCPEPDLVQLDVELAEPAELSVRLPGRRVAAVEGAELRAADGGEPARLAVDPGPGVGPRRARVALRFEPVA